MKNLSQIDVLSSPKCSPIYYAFHFKAILILSEINSFAYESGVKKKFVVRCRVFLPNWGGGGITREPYFSGCWAKFLHRFFFYTLFFFPVFFTYCFFLNKNTPNRQSFRNLQCCKINVPKFF